MTPTTSAAIHDPCQSDRIRVAWSVASRTGIAKVGSSSERARGERQEEQAARARALRPARRVRAEPDGPNVAPSMVVPEATPGGRLRGQHPTPDPPSEEGGAGPRRAARGTPAGPPRRHPATRGARSPTARRAAGRGHRRGGSRPARRAPTLDASASRWNIDSPANRPPTATPYSPPASRSRRPARPSRPRRCAPSRGRTAGGRPPRCPCGSSRPAASGRRRPRTTSSYAVSTRISKRRQATRSDRLTRSPASGSTPRGSGDHQPTAPRRDTGIGNSPAR